MDFDDPIERRKSLARLVASAKGDARKKVGRPAPGFNRFIPQILGIPMLDSVPGAREIIAARPGFIPRRCASS
jgi:hypothetical protein